LGAESLFLPSSLPYGNELAAVEVRKQVIAPKSSRATVRAVLAAAVAAWYGPISDSIVPTFAVGGFDG